MNRESEIRIVAAMLLDWGHSGRGVATDSGRMALAEARMRLEAVDRAIELESQPKKG